MEIPKIQQYHFLAHIIRDIFPRPTTPFYYGQDGRLVDVFRRPEHGFGLFFGCEYPSRHKYARKWSAIGDSFFGTNYADFFLSLDDRVEASESLQLKCANFTAMFVKRGGFVLLINPGTWASKLGVVMTLREDLIKEAKRYKILSSEEVFIYENI